jgi:hypothetical protein
LYRFGKILYSKGEHMASIALEQSHTRRKRRSQYPHGVPRDPKKILKIIRMRDVENRTWKYISDKLEMSRQGPFELYKRWLDWAKENNYYDT